MNRRVLRLVMYMDNACFFEEIEGSEEFKPGKEAARILREAADEVEWGAMKGTVRDINGNSVCSYAMREEPIV
jgi:hypothetical protein